MRSRLVGIVASSYLNLANSTGICDLGDRQRATLRICRAIRPREPPRDAHRNRRYQCCCRYLAFPGTSAQETVPALVSAILWPATALYAAPKIADTSAVPDLRSASRKPQTAYAYVIWAALRNPASDADIADTSAVLDVRRSAVLLREIPKQHQYLRCRCPCAALAVAQQSRIPVQFRMLGVPLCRTAKTPNSPGSCDIDTQNELENHTWKGPAELQKSQIPVLFRIPGIEPPQTTEIPKQHWYPPFRPHTRQQKTSG